MGRRFWRNLQNVIRILSNSQKGGPSGPPFFMERACRVGGAVPILHEGDDSNRRFLGARFRAAATRGRRGPHATKARSHGMKARSHGMKARIRIRAFCRGGSAHPCRRASSRSGAWTRPSSRTRDPYTPGNAVLLRLAGDIPDVVPKIPFITDDVVVEGFVPAEWGMGR
jgi:hypothetical protein